FTPLSSRRATSAACASDVREILRETGVCGAGPAWHCACCVGDQPRSSHTLWEGQQPTKESACAPRGAASWPSTCHFQLANQGVGEFGELVNWWRVWMSCCDFHSGAQISTSCD